MRNFVNKASSIENVGFLLKDLYNYLHIIKREQLQDGDAKTVMAYLYGKQESNPFFFVRHTRDEFRNLEKLLWADGVSRADYKEFRHVLAFDTTYKSNAYNKSFVVLVGVNHHRNTMSFGCIFLVDNKDDMYVWVLQ
ncbi:protein FAR1-RELATED SEQUENCE 5-like [Hibiscus syriacus]|uniref:protein FAR1-RELATED SEQUENCE 5-like n=1 Tax=Hibiscus syriacus TaxID=106335 RepID=UPI00192387A7|nr:protein FAR1-RELATED SEQUENCE 5-like [Hibiscus syriacus]